MKTTTIEITQHGYDSQMWQSTNEIEVSLEEIERQLDIALTENLRFDIERVNISLNLSKEDFTSDFVEGIMNINSEIIEESEDSYSLSFDKYEEN